MSEIVNLRRVRKARARVEASAQAEANRAKRGVSKRARDLVKAEGEKAQRDLTLRKLDEK